MRSMSHGARRWTVQQCHPKPGWIHADRTHTRRPGRFQVRILIAEQDAARRIRPRCPAQRSGQQARGWFAAGARPRRVGTELDRVQVRAARRQPTYQFPLHRQEIGFSQHSCRNTALVGHQHRSRSAVVDGTDSSHRFREQHQVRRPINVPGSVLVECPVAVEEDDVVRRARPSRGDRVGTTAEELFVSEAHDVSAGYGWLSASTASHQAWVHSRCTSWIRGV